MSELASFLELLADFRPQLMAGLGNTLLLAGIVSVTGLLGGIAVFYLTLHRNRMVRQLTEGYVSFFLGMPLIVLLFLMYYGLPQFDVRPSPFTVALVGFTMNVSAYNARYLATAYGGLDQDELMAARAQGFGEIQVFRLITLPQVLRLSVPALSNQVILNLKDSSVAFLIQYAEFFSQAQDLAIRSFRFFEVYVAAGLVYLAMVSLVVWGAMYLERRYVLPGTRRP